ncbi:MAG: UDP-N-acetylglucosamine 2-epimerase (hydrolyzing) [Candidatus Omnitrophica bacterium]|nr:UDP-N-acetylglucosamine 2-epimerase (hydrolyzing) [Candidatus Omnitrophota bacterium]
MRSIGVVTVSRSDYGILLPLLRGIHADPELALHLIVSGTHLSPEFGLTVRAIEEDGFPIAERVNMLLSSDAPEGTATAMGLGMIGFAQAYARTRPDLLVVVGDRFETHAAVAAAVPLTIPVAHIHGGESTEGLIDELFRHSITKMSHLHFAATSRYAQRIMQMGEEPWRVVVSGAPSLDTLRACRLLSKDALQRQCGVNLEISPLLVTYHPVTLESDQTESELGELLAALRDTDRPSVFTYPNADTHGRRIIDRIRAFEQESPRAHVVVNLGTQAYFSLMSHAAAMVGNSSSGLIEAASFKLPVVNIGNRQGGRDAAANVIHVGSSRTDILGGIQRALSPEFRESLAGLVNPYGDGAAAARILKTIKEVPLDRRLLIKRFYSQEQRA